MLDYHYITFLAVCETLNYTKAGEILNFTQPAVSKHISQLQEKLGVTLFEYRQKQLHLTEAGKYLYELVSRINKEGEKGLKRLLYEDFPREITLSCTFTIGNYLISKALIGLSKRFPFTHFNIYVENTRDLLQSLDLDRIECGFVEGNFDKEAFQHRLFRKEPLIGICSPNSKFAGKKITWNDIVYETFILREYGSGLGKLVENEIAKNGLFLDQLNVMHIGNYSIIKDFVKNNLGITFLYKCSVEKELEKGTLVKMDFEKELYAPEMFFIYRKSNATVERILKNFDLFENID
ncbi:MAG: LysR family transcriptional regulator [Miniphocaeibacter sp.]|uniref:LysR family transcriptional regulator n=1 Tax=Miniphocaeibacter sp. TaxID=3100973 RepID=UPI0017D9894E|nr:LysR family transcriptional regulator [Gallicola sp.]